MSHMKKVLIASGKALCYALLFVFSQFFVMFAANAVFTIILSMQSFGPYGTVPPYEELLNAALAFTEKYASLLAAGGDALALLTVWAVFRLRGRRLSVETNWRKTPSGTILVAAACGVIFAAIVSLILSILPIPEEIMQGYEEASSEVLDINAPLVMLALVFIGPISEEVFFRGLVYTRLKRGMPRVAAMILASLIFAVIHGNIVWIAYAFCAGMLMNLVFEKSGTLWASIAFHCAFNFAGSYVSGLMPDMSFVFACVLCLALVFALFLLIRNISAVPIPVGDNGQDGEENGNGMA